MKKQPYEEPKIVDEKEFETQAMACQKTPGLGALDYCGQVWASPSGNQSGCYTNEMARSS